MGEMNERRTDFELLQRFTRQGDQPAFADLVRSGQRLGRLEANQNLALDVIRHGEGGPTGG